MLTGCGGGGGSSSPPPVTVTPTPAPTPVPTPTPTPSASVYPTFFNLAQSRSVESYAASVTIQTRYTPGATPLYAFESATASLGTDPRALLYGYNMTDGAVTLNFEGKTIVIPRSTMTEQTDAVMRSGRVNLDADSWAVLWTLRPGPNFKYFTWSELELNWSGFPDAGAKVGRQSLHRFLLGIETRSGDMPLSGVRRYTGGVSTSTLVYDGMGGFGGTAPIEIDFSSRKVSGIVPVNQTSWTTGTTPLSASLKFEGTINTASNTLQGSVTSAEGYSGTFRGKLFGPASELGLIFTLERDGKGVVGTLMGIEATGT